MGNPEANKRYYQKIKNEPIPVGDKLGEIRSIKGRRYIWYSCKNCGGMRWVTLNKITKPESEFTNLCNHCWGLKRGENNRILIRKNGGYNTVYLFPDDPFYKMANYQHRIFEHRLVVARHLGRFLTKEEVVHHRNGIKDDNRLENLELMLKTEHKPYAVLMEKIKRLENEVGELRESYRLSLWLIKELQAQKGVLLSY